MKRWHISLQPTVAFSLPLWTHSVSALSIPTYYSSELLRLGGPFRLHGHSRPSPSTFGSMSKVVIFSCSTSLPSRSYSVPSETSVTETVEDLVIASRGSQQYLKRWACLKMFKIAVNSLCNTSLELYKLSSPHPSTNILKCLVLGTEGFQDYEYGQTVDSSDTQDFSCTAQNILVKSRSQITACL